MPNAGVSLTRRDLFKASAGTAVLMMSWDLFGEPSVADATQQRAPFFVYGLPASGDRGGASFGLPPAAGSSAQTPTLAAAGLATAPVKSQDGSALALIQISDNQAEISLNATVVSMASGSTVTTGRLSLPSVPQNAYVVVTPTFTPDGSVLAVVLSIMVPSNWRTGTKTDARTGQTLSLPVASWTIHHELAYLACTSGVFTGPFDLGDAPTLPRCTAVASNSDLYLWTLQDPIHSGPKVSGAAVVPQLAAYPLGSSRPRFSVPAPGPWPVNSEPALSLESGDIVRFVYANTVERYAAATGAATSTPVTALQLPSAQQANPRMELLSDGTVFLTNPVVGRAVIADPGDLANPRSVVNFPPPSDASSAGDKAALSGDGRTLYVTGGQGAGGLSAYDVKTGLPVATYSDSNTYSSVRVLPSGALVGATLNPPTLNFFDSGLHQTGTAPAGVAVAAIY
jgi:hypothetical protein